MGPCFILLFLGLLLHHHKLSWSSLHSCLNSNKFDMKENEEIWNQLITRWIWNVQIYEHKYWYIQIKMIVNWINLTIVNLLHHVYGPMLTLSNCSWVFSTSSKVKLIKSSLLSLNQANLTWKKKKKYEINLKQDECEMHIQTNATFKCRR